MSEDKRYCGKLTEEWLQDYPARTRTRYRNRFKKALKWLGMTDAEVVAEYKRATDKEAWRRKWGHKVKQYYTYLVEEKGMAVNTARADISGLRAFLTFHCMTVKIKKGAIPKPQRATGEHHFTLRELQRMYAVGDAREQAILSTAVCLGWGYGDFSRLQTKQIKALIENAKGKQY